MRVSRPRQYGSPGASANLARRAVAVRWQRASLPARATAAGLVAATGAIAGYAGYRSLAAAGTGAAVALAVAALVLAVAAMPGVLATAAVVAATVACLPLLGALYTLGGSGVADPVGGSVALLVAYAVAMWIALRYGRGRAWVSAIVVGLSMIVPGMVLLAAAPELGLNAARASLLIAAVARSSAPAWLADAAALAWNRLRHGRDEDDVIAMSQVDPADASLAWQRQEVAERATARALAALGPDYAVLHDVSVPGGGTIAHLVVGPTGVKLIASAHALGPVVVHPRDGLQAPHVDLAAIAWHLMQGRHPILRALRCHPRDAELIIVIHGSAALERMSVAAIDLDGAGRRGSTRLIVTGPEDAAAAVSEGLITWGRLKTRQTIRRARMRLVSAPIPQRAPRDAPSPMELVVLDPDGNRATAGPTSPDGQWTVGDRVSIRTALGVLDNLRVVAPPALASDGTLTVRVCSDADWAAAGGWASPALTARSYSFPVDATEPAGP